MTKKLIRKYISESHFSSSLIMFNNCTIWSIANKQGIKLGGSIKSKTYSYSSSCLTTIVFHMY